VGAMKVSEFAKNLELAGKNDDVAFVTENNDEFFASVNKLLENIKPVLEKISADNEAEAGEEDLDKLKESLTKLKSALDEMDMSTIDAIVAELQSLKFAGTTKDMVEGVFHAILMFEYDEATSKIDELLRS
jgi:hypothetical protein